MQGEVCLISLAHSHLFVTVLKIIAVCIVWILASHLSLTLFGLEEGVRRIRGVLAVKMIICSKGMLLGNLGLTAIVIAGRRTLSAVVLLQELMQGEVCLISLAHSHLFVTVLKIIAVCIVWILASHLSLTLFGLEEGVCRIRSILTVKMVIGSQGMLLGNLRITTIVIAG